MFFNNKNCIWLNFSCLSLILIKDRKIVDPTQKEYNPDHVLRQLAYVQDIPSSILEPNFAYRPTNTKRYEVEFNVTGDESSWQCFSRSLSILNVSGLRRAGCLGDCSSDYMDWYFTYSYPILLAQDTMDPALPNTTNTHYWMARHYYCYEMMDQMAQDWNRTLRLDCAWDTHDDDGGSIE